VRQPSGLDVTGLDAEPAERLDAEPAPSAST
jgi:hypothetical protein